MTAASLAPDSAMTRRSSGISVRRRSARVASTSSVRRSRLLSPIRRASVASAARSSRSSCASTSGSRPIASARSTRRARRFGGWRTASRRTTSAPAARTIGSWMSSTTNSFASTGIETASRTARRSSSEPPNQCGSHRTEIAAAPPASYARARATMSSAPEAMRPADGDERLISAIRWRPGAARRSATGRGAGEARAASSCAPSDVASTSSSTSRRRRSAISWTTLCRARVDPRRGAAATVTPALPGGLPPPWRHLRRGVDPATVRGARSRDPRRSSVRPGRRPRRSCRRRRRRGTRHRR
jgi:hypothetical protein